jgi:outer membrane protein
MIRERIADALRIFAGVAILFAVVAQRTSGQEVPAQPLTLEQAVRMALRQNPDFQEYADESQAARARWKQEQAGWYPRFDFHQNFTRGNNPVYVFGTKLTQHRFSADDFQLNTLNTPRPLDNFQTRLDGQWTLFDSGETLFHQRSARKLVTAADFATEQARQDLIFEVIRSYYGVLVLEENLRAAGEAVKTAELSAQRMETMHKAGLIVDSDLLSAKVFLAQMKDRQIRAQNDQAVAKMQLAREMGLPVDTSADLSQTFTEPLTSQHTIEDWIKMALDHRPALRAVQFQQDAMEQERKAAKAEFGPKVGLFGSTERDAMTLGGASGTNWTAGIQLDVNLFAGGAQKAKLAEATANASKARHSVEWFRSGVQMEVRRAYLDANAAAQRTAAAHDASDQAKESLRIVQNRYETGLTTATELFRTQTALLEAITGYLLALQDWHVARAQLARAAGVLTPESALVTGADKP